MQSKANYFQNQNGSLLSTFGNMLEPVTPKVMAVSKPIIEVMDFEVTDDYDVKLKCQWGNDEFEIDATRKVAEEWANHASKLTINHFDGEEEEVEFEPYMAVEFNFDQANELARYILKYHFKLVGNAKA